MSPTGQMLQRNPLRPFLDQRLEMGRLTILHRIDQRQTSQLDSCGVREELSSLLLRRLDTTST
jgi:hypothetical protein